MGMFDHLACEYPLPLKEAPVTGYQTKDTPAQWFDLYTIKPDGTLWGQEYEIEDRSNPNATGIERVLGKMTKVNVRDVPCRFTGEIVFYQMKGKDWLEFSAYFVDGQIQARAR